MCIVARLIWIGQVLRVTLDEVLIAGYGQFVVSWIGVLKLVRGKLQALRQLYLLFLLHSGYVGIEDARRSD